MWRTHCILIFQSWRTQILGDQGLLQWASWLRDRPQEQLIQNADALRTGAEHGALCGGTVLKKMIWSPKTKSGQDFLDTLIPKSYVQLT